MVNIIENSKKILGKLWQRAFLTLIAYLIVIGFVIAIDYQKTGSWVVTWTNIWTSILGIFLIFSVLFVGIEILISLVIAGNYFIIIGLLLLIISVLTFALEAWDKEQIDRAFIVAVATMSIYFTFMDFLKVSNFSEKAKYVIGLLFFIGVSIFNITILMVRTPTVVNYVNELNTDYLTFVALGIAISSIGLRQHKEGLEKKEPEQSSENG